MRDLTAGAVAPSSAESAKAWLTLQAELLLGGYRADLLDADGRTPTLTVSRWAMERSFDDLDEARAWTDQVLGRPKQQSDSPTAQECGLSHGEASRHEKANAALSG